jgi:hypothetical protein
MPFDKAYFKDSFQGSLEYSYFDTKGLKTTGFVNVIYYNNGIKDNLGSFYRLNLAPINKYFKSKDYNLNNTGDITCQFPNKYCSSNNVPYVCESGYYLNFNTNGPSFYCVNKCPAGTMVKYGMNPSSADVVYGTCSLPCGNPLLCMSSFNSYKENLKCSNAFTNAYMDCNDSLQDDWTTFFFGSNIFTPVDIIFPIKENFKNYLVEFFFYGDKKYTNNSYTYIFFSNASKIRNNDINFPYRFYLQDPVYNLIETPFDLNYGQWHRLIIHVSFKNFIYKVDFYNSFSDIVSYTSDKSHALSEIHFKNIYTYTGGFYKNLKVWDMTNLDIIQFFQLDKYFNIDSHGKSTRMLELAYYYPLTISYMKDGKIKDPDYPSNTVDPSFIKNFPSITSNFSYKLWFYSYKFDFVKFNKLSGKYISTFSIIKGNPSPVLANCNKNCDICNSAKCLKCNNGYYLSQGLCQPFINSLYFLNFPSKNSTNTKDIIFQPISNMKTFTLTFYFKLLGWYVDKLYSTYDVIRINSNMSIRINLKNFQLELYNPKNYETLSVYANFQNLRGNWTIISVAFQYEDLMKVSFYVNFKSLKISEIRDESVYSRENEILLVIPKESLAVYSRVWIYNKYLIGPTNISYLKNKIIQPIKKLLEPSSNIDSCYNLSDFISNSTYSLLCSPEYDDEIDETKFCNGNTDMYTSMLKPNGISSNFDLLSFSTCTCPWTGDVIIFESQCLSVCPSNMAPNESGQCIDTSQGTLYFLNGKATTSCPPGYFIDQNKNCFSCKSINRFFYNGDCFLDCPQPYAKLLSNFTCVDCTLIQGQNLFYNNYCVNICHEGTVIEEDSDGRKTCMKCEKERPYIYNNKCLSQCPFYFSILNSSNICERCSDNDKYYFRGNCVDMCPENMQINYETKSCELPLIDLQGSFLIK